MAEIIPFPGNARRESTRVWTDGALALDPAYAEVFPDRSHLDHKRYQGKMRDPVTGLYYFRNRWYSVDQRLSRPKIMSDW